MSWVIPVFLAGLAVVVVYVAASLPWFRHDCGREGCSNRHNKWHKHRAGPPLRVTGMSSSETVPDSLGPTPAWVEPAARAFVERLRSQQQGTNGDEQ